MKTLRLSLLSIAALFIGGLRNQFATANAEGTTGSHGHAIHRYADAAITTRYLLVKKGSDNDHIAVAGAADLPYGTVADEPALGDRVAIQLLGKGPTKKMVASAALASGVEVFTAAAGKVQGRPSASGTYWYLGVTCNSSAADGDVLEVNDTAPVKLVIA